MSNKESFYIAKDLTYLNNGASGACLKEVFAKKNEFEILLEEKGSRFMDGDYPQLFTASRASLAKHLVSDETNLSLIPNVTFGINIIINSIVSSYKNKNSSLKKGAFIITNQRYKAYERLWQKLEKTIPKKEIEISFPKNSDDEIFEEFIQQIKPEETSFIYLSHISSPTSLIFPVQKICAWARQHEILTIIDGAHAPGMLDLNLSALGADFYLGDCHKWMSSAKGCGFMYVREELKSLLEPLIISYGKTFPGGSGEDFIDDNMWCGINNYSAFLVLPELFKIYESMNWANQKARARSLTKKCFLELSDLFKESNLLYPVDSELYGQMFSFELPCKNIENLKNDLYEKHNIISGGINFIESKSKRRTLIRPSFAVYNDENDLEKFLVAVKELS